MVTDSSIAILFLRGLENGTTSIFTTFERYDEGKTIGTEYYSGGSDLRSRHK
jgi:hypothetical protein